MNDKLKLNLIKYINSFPVIGLLSSLLSFILFFGIIGVEDHFIRAVMYCLMPFIAWMLFYVAFKLVLKKYKD